MSQNHYMGNITRVIYHPECLYDGIFEGLDLAIIENNFITIKANVINIYNGHRIRKYGHRIRKYGHRIRKYGHRIRKYGMVWMTDPKVHL